METATMVQTPTTTGVQRTLTSIEPADGEVGYWIELRKSMDMQGKDCRKGADCTRRVCGYAHDEGGTGR